MKKMSSDDCLDILFEDFASMSPKLYKEACGKARWFLDLGEEKTEETQSPATQ